MGLTHSSQRHDINYTGSWRSNQYPTVRGTMGVYIPANTQGTFAAEALVSYSSDSSFRPGGHLSLNIVGTNNYGSNMTLTSHDQNIRYTITDINNMSGTYESIQPSDHGVFQLHPVV